MHHELPPCLQCLRAVLVVSLSTFPYQLCRLSDVHAVVGSVALHWFDGPVFAGLNRATQVGIRFAFTVHHRPRLQDLVGLPPQCLSDGGLEFVLERFQVEGRVVRFADPMVVRIQFSFPTGCGDILLDAPGPALPRGGAQVVRLVLARVRRLRREEEAPQAGRWRSWNASRNQSDALSKENSLVG